MLHTYYMIFFFLIMNPHCQGVSFKKVKVFCLLSPHRLKIAILCRYKSNVALIIAFPY